MSKLSNILIFHFISILIHHTYQLDFHVSNNLKNFASPHIQSTNKLAYKNQIPLTSTEPQILISKERESSSYNTKILINEDTSFEPIPRSSHLHSFKAMPQILAHQSTDNNISSPSQEDDESQDLAQAIKDTQENIDTNIGIAQQNIEYKLKATIKKMEQEIEKGTSKLVREMQNDTRELNKTIENSTEFLSELMQNETKVVTEQINIIDDDVAENIYQTEDLTMIVLSEQIDLKETELIKVNEQITELKAELPPPPSICIMYTDCTTCTANPKCGWCSDTQTCVSGDNNGPLYSTCGFYDYQLCSGSGCIIHNECQVKKNFNA